MTTRPRRLAFRGWVNAGGLVLAREVLGEGVCRARVLALWHSGCRLYEVDAGWLLLFAQHCHLDSQRAAGSPLVDQDGVLASCPLSASERADFERGSVVIVDDGRAGAVDLAAAPSVDPAAWLDVTSYCWLPVEPIVSPPAVIAHAGEPAEPEIAGALIGQLGTAPPGRQALRDALANLRSAKPRDGQSSPLELAAQPARPSWFRRLLDRSPWARLIGRQHARYLRAMAKMFERGDLDKALLHAIPAGEVGNPSDDASAPLSRIGPRSSLDISAQRTPARGRLSLNENSFDYVRELYRRAFEQLERAGRIDEAAYVLLELLGETEEGVKFLDEHDRSGLAAEVAEARGLEPGLVVRLWFRAGEPARAVRFAIRTGCFADAVVRLERTDSDAAAKLRLLWADHAASTGDYATAVDAAWPIPEARHRSREWIDRGIDVGGPLGARMLVKKLELAPEHAPEVVRHATELMADSASDSLPTRLALGRAVRDAPATPNQVALGSVVCRGLLRDAGLHPRRELTLLLKALDKHHVSGVLRADMPSVLMPSGSDLRERTDTQLLRFDAHDTGTVPLRDGALLPNGRLLIALGELGLQLRGRRGALMTHFDCPAHRLAVAANGTRAFAIAPRANMQLITRIDVERRKAEPWTQLALTAYAPAFDGALWFVSTGDDVLALDTTARAPEAVWRVAESTWQVRALAADADHLSIWWERDDLQNELWTYALPSLRLQHRLAQDYHAGIAATALAPHGALSLAMVTGTDLHRIATRLFVPDGRRTQLRADLGLDCLPRALDNDWLVSEAIVEQRLILQLHDVVHARPRMSIALDGTSTAHARLAEATMTVADERGRLIVISTETGELLRDLRISV